MMEKLKDKGVVPIVDRSTYSIDWKSFIIEKDIRVLSLKSLHEFTRII